MGKAAPVEVRTTIAATPREVYDLVADLPRMGEFSPECRSVSWRQGAGAAQLGVRFIGRNQNGWRRWNTRGVITAADPGRRLQFQNHFLGLPMSTWTYEFRAQDGGTLVTERWEDRQIFLTRLWIVGWLVTGVGRRGGHNRTTMEATLQQIRRTVESAARVG